MPSPRYWREIPGRFRLEAVRCRGCGRTTYPARHHCPGCRGTDLESVRLSRSGTVVTATVVRVAPDDLQMEAPYALAVIETPEHVRLMAQVVDCDPVAVGPGTEVSLEFRLVRREGRTGILCYGHKAVPREPATAGGGRT